MKSCVDTAIASQCHEVVGQLDPRPQRRIIAAAVGVGCQKGGGVGSFFLEKNEEKRG